MSTLILFGGLQALFLACLQFLNKALLGRSVYWLVAVSICLSISLFDGYLYLSEQYRDFPELIGIAYPIALLFEPLIYGYIYHLIGQRYSYKFILHFIPAITVFLLLSPIYFFPEQVKLQLVYGDFPEGSLLFDVIFWGFIVLSLGVLIQTPVYVWLIIKRTQLYRKALQSLYSSEAKTSIRWLFFIVASMLVTWILTLIQQLTVSDPAIAQITTQITHLFLVIIAFSLCYMGFQKQRIFNAFITYTGESEEETRVESKYVKSSLNESTSKQLFDELVHFIETSRCYLQHELTLMELADSLSVSTNHLSQCINQNTSASFFDFINLYRVNAAKQQLLANRNQTITRIATDVGFNSKSAFYNAFKKFAKQTPSAYREASKVD